MQPYEVCLHETVYADQAKLHAITPSVDSVNELEFVQALRDLMRPKNILSGFSEFGFEHLAIEQQTFEDYKSKYLDFYDKVKNNTQKEKVSILEDVDFELELIQRDDITCPTFQCSWASSMRPRHGRKRSSAKRSSLCFAGGGTTLQKKRIDREVYRPEPAAYSGDRRYS